MPAETLSCPYCNSYIAAGSAVSSSGRTRCPRCQEMLPYRASDATVAQGDGQPTGNQSLSADRTEPETATIPPSHWSNNSVAGIVLVVIASMAVIGFAYAWYTKAWRRERDQLSAKTEPLIAQVTTAAPIHLTGLSYLPADTDIVLGVHLAELLMQKQGQDLLPALFAATNFRETDLEQWIGLKLDELDYVLVGLKTQDRIIPRVTLVVVTRRPYDPDKLRAALKVGRRSERGGRTIYRFTPSDTSLEGSVWFAGDRTLVLGLIPEDFAEIPSVGDPAAQTLARELVDLIAPLKEGTPVWLVGLARDWERFLSPSGNVGTLPILPPGLSKESRVAFAKIREFSFWLELAKDVELRFAIGFAEPEAARQLLTSLQHNKGQLHGGLQKLQEWNVPLQLETNNTWLKGNARCSVEALREMLKR